MNNATLEIKNLTPEEVKINLEFCSRCDKKVSQGWHFEDDFLCNSCTSYLEARAESLVDSEIEQSLLGN